ncbi:MAG: Gfo/Idh/MocA family oxidoreductase [bacterium]|nr:Gfo/Idh/MocA family oxidoreductase [bacterium]
MRLLAPGAVLWTIVGGESAADIRRCTGAWCLRPLAPVLRPPNAKQGVCLKRISLIVAGAGSRGTAYSEYALAHPDRLRIVGVAEPREYFRRQLADAHEIPAANRFSGWRQMATRERFADGVIIATQDAMHVEPAEAFAARGYHMLLEKPMAPDAAGCRRITGAVERAGIIFAVCHVLRYSNYTRKLKELIASGVLGEIISIQHLEPVGYWHQAHSFVRGNWRNETESTFMLLAKSCHDLDWLRHIMGSRCLSTSSFGALTHFRAANKPAGASARCLDCILKTSCPYSAPVIYSGFLQKGTTGWPLDVVCEEVTEENLHQALREGPYGRCVYDCDNDVVDHQIVNLLFEGDRTAAFTMTAFTRATARRTGIFGTHGELTGDGAKLRLYDFRRDTTREFDTSLDDDTLAGHDGGDFGLMDSFVRAVAAEDRSLILSGARESLESHLMVFAAELARREHRVVDLAELS